MATKKKARRDYGGKPSVTTVIGSTLGWSKDALIGWAHKLGREGRSLRERDDAAALGSAVHALVARHYGAEEDVDDTVAALIDQARPNAERVIAWIDERYAVIECERQMIGSDYAGTLDLVLRDKERGDLVIADLKTGRGVYDEVAIQLGAYAALLDELDLPEGELRGWLGLVISAHAGEEIKGYEVTAEAIDLGAEAFQRLLWIYTRKKQIGVTRE